MSEQLQGLLEQVAITAQLPGQSPAKKRRPRPDAWPKAAVDIIDRDYGYIHITSVIANLQPHFTKKVSPNMVFGKANRMGIAGRCPKYQMKLLPTSPHSESEASELPVSNGQETESQ